MGGGARRKSKQAAAPPKSLPAQGKGKQKRTPQSAFDEAAGKDIYEPEKIIAQRIAKGGITQYQVKWKAAGTPRPTRCIACACLHDELYFEF
jgi:hypothetical protein